MGKNKPPNLMQRKLDRIDGKLDILIKLFDKEGKCLEKSGNL